MRRFRFRVARGLCKGCKQPIEHEPTTDGNWYGWEPASGRCYPCHLIDLFGPAMQPSEDWWRKVRPLVKAGHQLSLFNDNTEVDLEF
jgi:hypothetical protein